MSRRKMTDSGGGTECPRGTSADSAIFGDAITLKVAIQDAIRTSPNSFLKTLADIQAKENGYWIDQIQSSTWVVAERDGRVVGVAACKSPEQGKDKESPRNSRYIESVWIHPDLRGHRLAERLIGYLMAAEFGKSPDIRQFLLWVFDTNLPAIVLYKRMNFAETPDRNEGSMTEIKYRLYVDPETSADIRRSVGEAVLLDDKLKHGVTYRILGEGDSASSRLRRSDSK
jgi:ribosomal protein S18 acetylase RimI-like enzyme